MKRICQFKWILLFSTALLQACQNNETQKTGQGIEVQENKSQTTKNETNSELLNKEINNFFFYWKNDPGQAYRKYVSFGNGPVLIYSSGAMPQFILIKDLNENIEGLEKSLLTVMQEMSDGFPCISTKTLPKKICEDYPYDKRGCFYIEENQLSPNSWDRLIPEALKQHWSEISGKINITLVHTQLGIFYFYWDGERLLWLMADIRVPCQA
ncbi:MAG: hypothetical protein KatS3mg034_0765 [Vicingaceae bacterium]|nr:MAG: hypothetical protein KatS3mg034_0765 [Vicingaceae bacterium]